MGATKFIPIIFTADGASAEKVVRGLTSAFEQLDDKAEQTSSGGLRSVFIQADLASRAIAATTREVIDAAREYLQFNAQLANLNTILSDDSSLTTFRNGILDLDPALGHASELTRGLYQTISSNVDAVDSLQFLETSAKAAKAGLTSVNDTVSVGTTIMHSYGMKAEQVADIYDKLFETVNVGKVEFVDLAQSVGLVSSIASKAGVSLDEMLASIATASLTNRPSIAIEGLRAAIANVISPTKEASDEAQALGIQFDAQALKAKGLVKFLLDVTEATKGDSAALNKLFGDIQAFNFVQSVTGTQAKLLESSLDRVSNSAGRMSEAFEKQRQSLGAQAEEFKTTIEKGLIKSFLVAEPLISGVLSLVTKYPAAFVAAATVVTGLALAHAAYNTQLGLGAATFIPNLIKGLQTTVFWMGNVRTALATALAAGARAGDFAALASGVLGWAGLVAAAIGLVVYAYQSYETAAQRAEKITLESIQQRADGITVMREQAAELKVLADWQSLSTEEHDKLNRIIESLDPNTRTYIRTLGDEGAQIAATTRELERRLEIEKTLAGAKRLELTAGIVERQKEIEQLRNYQKELDQAVILQGRMASDGLPNQLELYASKLDNVTDQLKQKTAAQAADIQKVEVSNQLLGESREQYVANANSILHNASAAGLLRNAFSDLTASTQNHTDAQERDANGLKQGASAADQAADALKRLKDAQDAITKNRQLVSAATMDIVKNAANAAEARRQAQELMKNDAAFAQRVNDAKRFDSNQKAIDSYLFPGEHKTGSARSKLSSSDREDNELFGAVSRNLRAPRPADPALAALISQSADRYGVPQGLAFAQLYTESRFNKSAVSPAGAIGVGQVMPGTGARYGMTPNDLRDPKKNLTAWGKYMSFLYERYGDWDLAVLAYHQGEGTVDKLVKVLTSAQGGNADVKKAARGAGIIGRQGRAYLRDIRRYDYEGRGSSAAGKDFPELVLGGQFQKNPFTGGDDMTKPQVGGQLIQLTPAKLDGFLDKLSTLFTKMRSQPVSSGTVTPFDQVTTYQNSPTQQALVDYNAEVNKREEEAAGRRIFLAEYTDDHLREIRTDFYNRETQLSLDLAGVEETLAQHRRQAADDQLSEQRRLLAAKSAEVDLTRHLTELQEEYANSFTNLGLRRQVAEWEELVAIKHEDVEAIESQVRSQVRLADSAVVHTEQVRARVLEHLAENSSATNAWADGLTNSFDQISGAIDRGIAKMTRGAALATSLLQNLAHQLENRIFKQFLDMLFPEKGGAGGASAAGGGSEGSSGGSSIRNLFGGGGSGSGGFSFAGAAKGYKSGGLWGGIKGLFGFGSTAASAAAGAGAAGAAALPVSGLTQASLLSTLVPSSAAAGLGAGAAAGGGGAAAGAGAAGGTSLMSSMGAFFTNPWTAVGAAAIIGGIMLWRHFRNGTEKKLRSAIQSEYSVMVKDMNVLKSIKEIGEGQFGRGKVSAHLLETIRLDPARELIANYAEATGQKSSKLTTNAQLQDEGFAGNRFIRRIAGGPIPGVTRGFDHVPVLADAGEHMIDTATVMRNGGHGAFDELRAGRATVTRGTPLAKVMARLRERAKQEAAASASGTSARSSGSSSSRGTQQGGMPPALVAAIAGSNQEVAAALREFVAKVRSISKGELLEGAIDENPEAIGRGLDEATNRDSLLMTRISKKSGNG